ncbi:MAG TPA: isopentenyl-diphosphate Delta-isomerase [Gammaproteobacteria bacterium]|jgi:isopentenyl-diphosphate delta-isomerase type 1|nr:isopentenyl-diphosphate Delta-isomerase [Gammaproteobacteria bacterium]
MAATDYVILVDENDNNIGVTDKMLAHRHNQLHRAFSIFILSKDTPPQLLLQQRAADKYHSAGLWSNTCCSHPRPGESVIAAGTRRLQEEFGLSTTLEQVGSFRYNVHFPNGLSENELDHILIGKISRAITITPNPAEIQAYRWVDVGVLSQEIQETPTAFTYWLEPALKIVLSHGLN